MTISRGVGTEESPPRGYQASSGLVPVPDPTVLTTAQIAREIASTREIIESRVAGVESTVSSNMMSSESAREAIRDHVNTVITSTREVLETRLNGMDKALGLLQSIQDRVSDVMDSKLTELRNLHQEKFDSIAVQFEERDTRTEQTAAGVKIAVDAALQAAKEAVAEQNRSFALATGKSETATMKQIDALGLAIQTANKGLDDKIADMKDRLTRIEGMDLGSSRSHALQLGERADSHGGNQNMIAAGAVVAAVIGVLIGLGSFMYTITHVSPSMVYAQPVAPESPMRRQQYYLQDMIRS